MSVHRISVPPGMLRPGAPSELLDVAGDEAHHAARVKRLEPGEEVELLDGVGCRARACIGSINKTRSGEWSLQLHVQTTERVEPVSPGVDVFAAPPKGDRLAEMIDQLSQVGAAAWSPLHTERTVVEPRAGKLERLERIAHNAAKQCGRAWALRLGESTTFAQALVAERPISIVLADATGASYQPTGAARIRLLVGPEGGWSAAELEHARRSGVQLCTFGPHVMRVETAAPVAAALIMELERRIDRLGSHT